MSNETTVTADEAFAALDDLYQATGADFIKRQNIVHAFIQQCAAKDQRIAELEERLGITRMCVNCGATRPAEEGRETSGADCKSPNACTWDHTPHEAFEHWRREAHARSARVNELDAALSDIDADYMTSEQHHPGYVLIPTAKFEDLRRARNAGGR